MQITTVMVVMLISWCLYTLVVRNGCQPAAAARRAQHEARSRRARLAERHQWAHTITLIIIFVGLGHSLLAMSGEESLAQVYREIEHPKLKNLKKAGLVIFIYSLVFTSLVSFFAVMIIPDSVRGKFTENLIGGLAMHLVGPLSRAAGVPRFRRRGRHADSRGRREHGDRRLQRRAEPRVRRWRADRLVPPPHRASAPRIASSTWSSRFKSSHHHQPRRRDISRQPVRLRRDLEFRR